MLGATGGIERSPRSSWLSASMGKPMGGGCVVACVVVSLAVSGALYRENLSLREGQPLTAGVTTPAPSHHHGAR